MYIILLAFGLASNIQAILDAQRRSAGRPLHCKGPTCLVLEYQRVISSIPRGLAGSPKFILPYPIYIYRRGVLYPRSDSANIAKRQCIKRSLVCKGQYSLSGVTHPSIFRQVISSTTPITLDSRLWSLHSMTTFLDASGWRPSPAASAPPSYNF